MLKRAVALLLLLLLILLLLYAYFAFINFSVSLKFLAFVVLLLFCHCSVYTLFWPVLASYSLRSFSIFPIGYFAFYFIFPF